MAVIAVNFMLPLFVMFYCYYNVSVTVKQYKANNSLHNINIEWLEQMDVTKVKPQTHWLIYSLLNQFHTAFEVHVFCSFLCCIADKILTDCKSSTLFLAQLLIWTLFHDRLCRILMIVSYLIGYFWLKGGGENCPFAVCTMVWSDCFNTQSQVIFMRAFVK